MDAPPLTFELVFAAVIFGNCLTFAALWGAWTIAKAEREKGSPTAAPWSAFIAVLFPVGTALLFYSLA